MVLDGLSTWFCDMVESVFAGYCLKKQSVIEAFTPQIED